MAHLYFVTIFKVFLHGNTMLSKMFDPIINSYQKDYKVIRIDFLGYGRSDKLEQFEVDFWYDQALQLMHLVLEKQWKNVNLIGTSGGAITALNLALLCPELVSTVIADSFEGEGANALEANKIRLERDIAKQIDC